MTNEVQSTSYAAYRRLRLGYRLELQQHGTRITGQGEKWLENGRRIPGATRTPITLHGVIEGHRVALTFVERGRRRTSGGTFDLAPQLPVKGRWCLGDEADRAANFVRR